jgi:hypothetical protein
VPELLRRPLPARRRAKRWMLAFVVVVFTMIAVAMVLAGSNDIPSPP